MALRPERAHLLPLPTEGSDLAEVSFPKADAFGCVRVRTNFYLTPLLVEKRVQAKIYADLVEIWHEGAAVPRNEHCYDRQKQILELEHFLEVLEQKPGGLGGIDNAEPVARTRAPAG